MTRLARLVDRALGRLLAATLVPLAGALARRARRALRRRRSA